MIELSTEWELVFSTEILLDVDGDVADGTAELVEDAMASQMTACVEEPEIDFSVVANRRNYPYSYVQYVCNGGV